MTTKLPLFLAFFLTLGVLYGQKNYEVLLHSGTQTFPQNVQNFMANPNIQPEELVKDNYYRLLQFEEIPKLAQQSQMKAKGIQLLEYLPHYTYIAAISKNFDVQELEQFKVRSVMPIQPQLKLAQALLYASYPEWAIHRNQVELLLKYHKHLPQKEVIQWLQRVGVQVTKYNGHNNYIRIKALTQQIQQLAALPWVAYIDIVPEPGQVEEDRGKALHRSNLIDVSFDAGRHYKGHGVSVLVRDDGDIGPHIDFAGRVHQEDASIAPGQGHGDGVAGILAGAGNLNPRMEGMATAATIYVVDYQADFLDNTLDLHLENDVMITNSSYSNGCNEYTAITQVVDQQIYDNKSFLHVFSAGNSNGADCEYGAGNQWGNITGGHKQGKNVIATANLNPYGMLEESSSRGPAFDGRIKPDISANGAQHISTMEENTYQIFGGTSGAAPGIAGVAAQLYDAYRQFNSGMTPESGLIKACMLNTATDRGNPGPDFRFGWGTVHALRAVKVIEENRYFKDEVQAGETKGHTIAVPENVAELRVMTYWMDKEAAEMSAKALVSDINTSLSDELSNPHLPLVLNHIPNAISLNAPAMPGIDNLNNVEQIRLLNPAAGDYELQIEGTEIPFGIQEYYVVYEYIMDDIMLTYPYGGEQLAPGDTIVIHWDAYSSEESFLIEFSEDDGANWQHIASVAGSERLLEWIVNAEITSKAWFRVSAGTRSDTSNEPISIAPIPANLVIEQACPDYIRLRWEAADSAVAYTVYHLGTHYMDSIGTTTELFYDIPVTSPLAETNWFSVQSIGADGLVSRRAIALNYLGDLQNCQQDIDLRLLSVETPTIDVGVVCDTTHPIAITLINQGVMARETFQAAYQIDGGEIMEETVMQTVVTEETLEYTFTIPMTLLTSGTHDFKVWIATPEEQAAFNDTLQFSKKIVIHADNGVVPEVVETFEGDPTIPDDWLLQNPDATLTWGPFEVLSPLGDTTTAMFINNFGYSFTGEQDMLYTWQIDLMEYDGVPVLSFDLAYTYYDNTYFDSLRVDVSTDCGESFETVYYKGKDGLATVPAQLGFYTPQSAEDWRKEYIALAPYIGESVIVRFVNITGFGNSIFIDNINVGELDLEAPTAVITASKTEICNNRLILFNSESTGEIDFLQWDFAGFGTNVNLNTPGQHLIRFDGLGVHTVQLIVSNIAGSDTATVDIHVVPPPVAAYTYSQNQSTIQFENTSTDGSSYIWDFGDGNMSEEENPSHNYTAVGEYTATLEAINGCDENVYSEVINVTMVDIQEAVEENGLSILPNPTSDLLHLTFYNIPPENGQVRVFNSAGQLVQSIGLSAATTSIIDVKDLPSGVYYVKVLIEGERWMKKVVKL